MEKGDALAFYIDKFSVFAILIAFFSSPWKFITKGWWTIPTHIATYVGDNRIREALPFVGYVTRSLDEYGKRPYSIHRLKDISQEKQQQLVDFLKSKEGASYDFFAYIGFLFFPLMRLFRFRNPFQRQEDLFCSEAYVEGANSVGFKFQTYPGFTTPNDLITDPIMFKICG